MYKHTLHNVWSYATPLKKNIYVIIAYKVLILKCHVKDCFKMNDKKMSKKSEYIFFVYLGFLSRTFMIHRTAGEGGGYLFNSSLPLSPASETLRH